jgi:ketosteroid isomerase-like protein
MRKRASWIIGCLAVAIATPAAAQDGRPGADAERLPSVELPPELDRVLRDYERAWSGSDPAALSELFTRDGFALPLGRAPARGADAIRAAYENAGGPLRLRALAWEAGDSVAWIVGAYGYRPDGVDAGKFVLALSRSPGGPWRIAADIDSPIRRSQP